jgi:hypothetical protein
MPSMLGLTTDPSPHGLNAKGSAQDKRQWETENANYGHELAVQAAGSMSGAMKAGRDKKEKKRRPKSKKKDEGEDDDGEDDSTWKAPKKKGANRKKEADRFHLPEDKDLLNDEGGRKNTILARNQESAIEMETLIWRAMCDRPKSALKYIAKDAMISNWLVFGDTEPRTKDSEPSLEECIKECEPYMSYKMRQAQVVEIGLMAVAVVYQITLYGQAGEPAEDGTVKLEMDEATVSSTWRQGAGGDWELTSMTVG